MEHATLQGMAEDVREALEGLWQELRVAMAEQDPHRVQNLQTIRRRLVGVERTLQAELEEE